MRDIILSIIYNYVNQTNAFPPLYLCTFISNKWRQKDYFINSEGGLSQFCIIILIFLDYAPDYALVCLNYKKRILSSFNSCNPTTPNPPLAAPNNPPLFLPKTIKGPPWASVKQCTWVFLFSSTWIASHSSISELFHIDQKKRLKSFI